MTTSRKNGSALLIVLGFLSFMVVSAVAFAIYMRAERLPSSALRRNVATRHLVHAALAEAISRVDDAVRGDPFPGLCQTNTEYAAQGNFTYRDQQGQAMDVWQGRVFMPPDPLGGTHDRETRFAPVTETVSVLTLEGLGYLPPALVNDVRFLSRSSWAAQWQQLPFDAGRFAYCAVNVSDYFDINRLYANRGRTSEAGGRLSLGYLFDPSFDPTAPVGGAVGDVVGFLEGAKAFDKFVHESRPGGDDKSDDNTQAAGNTVPYISMLDYNLALGSSGGSSSLRPLFHDWIAGSSSMANYYQKDSPQAKSAARQPFVTESASTNETWEADIATAEGQPFPSDFPEKLSKLKNKSSNIIGKSSKFLNSAFSQKILTRLDYATLWDYLDHDDIPLSLGIPCVERVPMIAGLGQTLLFSIGAISPGESFTTKQGAEKRTSTPFEFKPQDWFPGGGGYLSTVVVFPFKHGKTRNKTSGPFKVQAFARVFLAPKGITSRSRLAEKLRPQSENDWNPGSKAFEFAGRNDVFMFTSVSDEIDLNVQNLEINDEEDVGCQNGRVAIRLNFSTPGDSRPFITKTEIQKVDEKDNPVGDPKTVVSINTCPIVDLEGNVAMPDEIELQTLGSTYGMNLVPYVCVWVRVVNNDGTVDLVPAYIQDDADLNGGDTEDVTIKEFAGEKPPLMHFSASGIDDLTLPAIVNGDFANARGPVIWSPKAVFTVDPRFNWAPEAWFARDTDATFENWLNEISSLFGTDGRDEDLFMFTSNQGVLQSLGEFAFLPKLHENGTEVITPCPGVNDGRLDFAKGPSETLNYGCAWRTYYVDNNWYAKWAEIGVGRSTEKECLVNPYTDSRAVMMAALANTPVDYWAAARGMASDCALRKDGAKLVNNDDPWYGKASDSLKHAFCSESEDTGDKLATQDLMRFCDRIMSEMRSRTLELINSKARDTNWSPSDAWKEVWDDLAWDVSQQNNGSVTKFLGIDQDMKNGVAFHSVDRKFLYSYWRDCFANNQQLFLIFVRAESNALGGPGEGTPAQQGGRAVALVWRNPSATRQQGRVHDAQNTYNTNGEREPHQTRVLFYHQFD